MATLWFDEPEKDNKGEPFDVAQAKLRDKTEKEKEEKRKKEAVLQKQFEAQRKARKQPEAWAVSSMGFESSKSFGTYFKYVYYIYMYIISTLFR